MSGRQADGKGGGGPAARLLRGASEGSGQLVLFADALVDSAGRRRAARPPDDGPVVLDWLGARDLVACGIPRRLARLMLRGVSAVHADEVEDKLAMLRTEGQLYRPTRHNLTSSGNAPSKRQVEVASPDPATPTSSVGKGDATASS